MAQIEDSAFILSVYPYAERDIIAHAFTRTHGVVHGLMKGAKSKRGRNVVDVGMFGQLQWKARLEEHLGVLRFESMRNYAGFWLHDPVRLHMLTSAASLIQYSLGAHDPHPHVFDAWMLLLETLQQTAGQSAQVMAYLRFERRLLEEAGFGLSLDVCAATGVKEGLIYVSPKTGRAISASAGAPYAPKMLPLPDFFRDESGGILPKSAQDLADGLRITGHFLAHTLREIAGKDLPMARQQLVRLVKNT